MVTPTWLELRQLGRGTLSGMGERIIRNIVKIAESEPARHTDAKIDAKWWAEARRGFVHGIVYVGVLVWVLSAFGC